MHLRNKIHLFKNQTIRSLCAGFLLLVFTVGIFPKKYLHDLIVNHKDNVQPFGNTKKVNELASAGFNCHIDNLVVQCPFVVEETTFTVSSPKIFASYHISIAENFTSNNQIVLQLRGPPFSSVI